MRRSLIPGLPFAVALLLGAAGCSEDSEGAATSADAFTVESGDRFVVSAEPHHIVLKKKVDGAAFPFTEGSLKGKAILIHPVSGRAEDGVYARALTVQSEEDEYVVDAKPLTLAEMEHITEDDIVRIYIDRKRSVRKEAEGATLVPEAWPFGSPALHPLGISGIGFSDFNMGGFDFTSPVAVVPGVSFKHTITEAEFTPDVLADYSSETGLQLGFRAQMSWKSKLDLGGKLSGEFFKSNTYTSPSLVVFLPIGIVPVPVSINAEAFVSCSASLADVAKLTLDIDIAAKLGASLQVSPSTGSSPKEWVKEGPWPAEASGHADIQPTGETSWGKGSASCAIPRIEFKAKIAGIAGPYVAVTPNVGLDDKGANFSASIAAGVAAGVLGVNTGVEVQLYKWTP